jgi:hypothetical protein
MHSPTIHTLLAQAHVDDLTRAAATSRRYPSTAWRRRQAPKGAGARRDTHGSTYRFLLHYAEMVAVMFAGMFALMAPTGILLSVFGTSWSRLSPAMNVFAMALTMTVPMVAWMRYRGHTWRANIEMSASMLIPTFAVMGLLLAGAAKGTLMVPEHAGMLSCMLAAMLLRRDEYSCAAHSYRRARPAIAA